MAVISKKWMPVTSPLILLLLLLVNLRVGAQSTSYNLRHCLNNEVKLDGLLKEHCWESAQKADGFHKQYPVDSGKAQTKTEVFMTYDDNALYVAAICYDQNPEKAFVIQSLKRDFSYPVSDAFAIYIDPFEDQANGFSFAVNPLGAQREGLLQSGGAQGVTTAWDAKWYSKVRREKNKWVVEMKIPFKSIRFRENAKTWNINFSRNNLKINENSSWIKMPRNFNIANLAYTGKLYFETIPKKPKLNLAIIPYLVGNSLWDKEAVKQEAKTNLKTGLDAKIAITPSLNLDVTVNSDFSQVEVDAQQINLTRFSLFFPEKRLFFIENSDLFANFGFRQIRPFFSRRIGLKNGEQVPILAGARLSGKLGRNWRIGAMNMQTKGKDSVYSAQNYSVLAVQRQVFKTSNIAAIIVNRDRTDDQEIGNQYNRVLGLDYNLFALKNKLRGKFFFHKSFTPENKSEQYTHASWLMYENRDWFGMWNHEYVGKNYNAEVGFVPRTTLYDDLKNEIHKLSYWRLEPEIRRNFFPKNSKLITISPGLYHDSYYDSTFTMTESLTKPYLAFEMKNSTEFGIEFQNYYSNFYFPSAILGDDSASLLFGEYNYNFVNAFYASNTRKKFYYNMELGKGKFYSADRTNMSAEVNYRYQPYGTFSISSSVDLIEINDKVEEYILIGTKAELAFTKQLFFSTFVQYNTQAENTNVYSRLQWRYKPMSDFFLVYSDNYNKLFKNRNRTISFKLIYWLNT